MYGPASGLQKVLEPVVNSMGYELVGIEQESGKQGTLVRLYIDKPTGIDLDDCARVSHQVSGVLDVEDLIRGQYTLEVSSPGLDRLLFTLDQFRDYIGERIKIRVSRSIDGRKRFSGKLIDIEDELIVLEQDGERYRVPYNSVDKARLVPQ